ncbi:MAG: hypothetical protein D6806_16795 [Deltaproteobacteria bacterium]|nr:MAG: hypothetical protein D6806_16795 [Deltaproteobacteria bacterium]
MKGRRKLRLTVVAAAMLAAGACGQPPAKTNFTVADITIAWPEGLGKPERPLSWFPHLAHEKELEKEGCAECHRYDEKTRKFTPALKAKLDLNDAAELEKGYHDFCTGCHRQRREKGLKHGPDDCGACHLERAPAAPPRLQMFFDYSLHQRHQQAAKKKCEKCHHLYDEKKKKLYYEKDKEVACFDCHLDRDQGRNLSWPNAAHTDCLSCHLELKKKGEKKRGPVTCAGCHDEKERAKIKPVEKLERLYRKQKDRIWVQTKNTPAPMVPFDHKVHEGTSFFCTGCHHKALKPCGECHDVEGKGKDSGGIGLERAHHDPRSGISCLGCHLERADEKNCRGCHEQMGRHGSEHTCNLCHSGPAPEKAPKEPPAELFVENPAPPPLPKESKTDFPKELVLDVGGKKYEKTKFPHLKVVTKLYKLTVKDHLAVSFMPKIEAFCAGCHHHQPLGQRPAACGSCHQLRPDLATDRPGLKEAYHRQCLGCHRAMGLKKQGCTDCHKEEKKPGKEAGS